ncbi:hypothetical protein HY637_02360 [Candidatus Woesearchaeota archaeon]|nr:hypothetical protein [Candidatus Woesearchaeota archaeon]
MIPHLFLSRPVRLVATREVTPLEIGGVVEAISDQMNCRRHIGGYAVSMGKEIILFNARLVDDCIDFGSHNYDNSINSNGIVDRSQERLEKIVGIYGFRVEVGL